MQTFYYSVACNVSGPQGIAQTVTVVAANLAAADQMIQARYPNHLIYLEGYRKEN